MKISIQTKILALFIALVGVGCNPQMNPLAMGGKLQSQNQNINDLPTTFEPPGSHGLPAEEPTQPVAPTQKPTSTPQVQTPSPKPKSQAIKEVASSFIQLAHRVMITEGKLIGTACNRYLLRVLLRAGFAKGDNLANDFDLYARKNFKSYHAEDFKIDSTRSDKVELKRYLWSYPERTPFIVQWTRPKAMGHVAIVERVGENLIIYQASYGKHTARRDQTSVESLLTSGRPAFLTIYSEFR